MLEQLKMKLLIILSIANLDMTKHTKTKYENICKPLSFQKQHWVTLYIWCLKLLYLIYL